MSIVIPLYNEEENVELLHQELNHALHTLGRSYEILFVDDGSRDETAAVLESISATDNHVAAVLLRRNCGQTAALQAGFDIAQGKIIVTLDGDLQNDPADIGALLEQIDQGMDVVSGWRKDRKDVFFTRRLPSIVANWLIGLVTGVRIHDNGCTLKAYRAEVVKRARLYSEMHRFLAPLLSLSGCHYKEIIVNHRERKFGQSKYGLSRIWKVFLDLLAIKMILRFASHPAVWFGVMAFPLVIASLASLAVSFWSYLSTPFEEFSVVLPSITALLMFGAAHLLVLGFFAELVVSTGDYREAQPIITRVKTRVS